MKTLSKMKVGESTYIKAINCPNEPLRRRLLDMGIIPNTKITLVKKAPMGDPLEIMLRGYSLTLRLEEANYIEVSEVFV